MSGETLNKASDVYCRGICFLTHMARSGSTLLARELDRVEGVGVGIEEALPDGIVWGRPVALHDPGQLESYLDKAFQDTKMAGWPVTKKTLRDELTRNHRFPLHFSDVLEALLDLYFTPGRVICRIHKKGPYYLHVRQVKRLFPRARFIHIDRDPRAIYNSQKKTPRSTTGAIMAEHPITFAFQYLQAHSKMNQYADAPYFYLVRYEDLLDEPRRQMAHLLEFLGIDQKLPREKEHYYQKIPRAQQKQHVNLQEEVMPERAHAWRKELSPEEVWFLQKALRRPLQESGRQLMDIPFLGLPNKSRALRYLLLFRLKKGFKDTMPGFYRFLKGLLKKGSSADPFGSHLLHYI